VVLPVVFYGDKILRTRCAEVEEITPWLKQFIADMIETMDAKNGIGIAAPQVGHSIRVFVLRNYIEVDGQSVLSDPQVYINPKILYKSEETSVETEGCLSIPGIREEVERPVQITIEAMDLEGNQFTEELSGYNARVRMHENDHLNGVLFVDRITPIRRKKIAHFLKQIESRHKR
jgi:peptide deformylase